MLGHVQALSPPRSLIKIACVCANCVLGKEKKGIEIFWLRK